MKISQSFFLSTSYYCTKVIKIFTLVFLLLLINFSNAQENSFEKIAAFKNFKDHTITAIAQDTYHQIWFATNKTLLKFDGEELKKIDFEIGGSSENIQTIFIKDDSIFIGKNKNLHLKTHNQLLTFDAKSVNKIFEFKDEIFVGSNQGLLHFRQNYLQPLKTTYNLDFSVINDIIYYNKNFIVASNSGLWILDDLINPKQINNVSKGNYSSLLKVNEKLYVLKNNSIIQKLNNNELENIYSKNNISSILLIENKIYATSENEGIDIFNANSFIFEKRLNKYNSNLNSNRINTVFEDAEQNIFIATESGLFIKKNKSLTKKPPLQIVDFTVNYISIDSININSYNKILMLNANENNISFLLESVSISHPKNIEFRYKLGDTFSPWSSNKQVNFASLKPGKYNFIAESRFKNSTKTTKKEFSFFIATPFYKKVWFLIFCAVLLCLILAGAVEIYIRKINKRNQQKLAALKLENHLLSLEQKALQLQMNPHFIFNVLNGIKALGNSDNKIALNKTISNFSILLRSVLNNSRLEEISLKEEITTLNTYLELEQQMSSKSFQFSIKTKLNNIDTDEILIPPMLVQPFVENAVKHGVSQVSNEGKINIIFEVKNYFLECFVIDNGVGIYQSQKRKTNDKHKSIALKVTKERIENISKHSAFTMEEIKDNNEIKGTKIWFKIPLKTDY